MKNKEILAFARQLRKNQTAAEQFFWEKVRNRRFLGKKFYRQYIIEHEDLLGDKKFFIADFCCWESRLIVELDGGVHLFQKDYDHYRERILKDLGFSVIRFNNQEIFYDWNTVAAKLVENL
ncbi:MAG: DUF559 domain-containing protein [Bacteroidia bacterium]|nr:DUF559 domain-containing protein [Bacteroidia bacterium]